MTSPDLAPAAHEAMDLARHIFQSCAPGRLTAKGDRDMASEVDYAIEAAVRQFLAERTPEVDFLGEENGLTGHDGGGLLWALDPVDGTVNFVHGSPLCGISLALLDGTRATLGVIDLPWLGHRYHAIQGQGAYRDDQPITVSTVATLREAVVAIGDYAVGPDATQRNQIRLDITGRLAATAQRVRMHGSAAVDFALLAEGAVDAVVIMSNNTWDTAAGVTIAREAGAVVTDQHGDPHDRNSAATIATNPHLTGKILQLCQTHV